MATTTSWNLDLLNPTLTAITKDAASQPSVGEQLVELKDGTNRSEFPMPNKVTTSEVGTLGPMAETEEHNPFYDDTPAKGYSKTTTYKKFTTKLTFSEEVAEDDLYGIIKQYAAEIGESYKLTRELQIAQIFDNLHNTTYFTGPDTLAICSASNTAKTGIAVRPNKLATSMSFGYQAMQNMLTLAARHKNMRGYPDPRLMSGSINIVIQPEDAWMYETLFSDRSNYEPGTNSNSPNVLKGGARTFNKIENVYQTGTGTASTQLWALQEAAKKGIWLVDRKKLTTSSYLQDGNKNMVYDGRARYWYHIKDIWGIWGSGD
jgi:hypothetical protein